MIPAPHFGLGVGISVCGEGALRSWYRRHFRSGGMSDRGSFFGDSRRKLWNVRRTWCNSRSPFFSISFSTKMTIVHCHDIMLTTQSPRSQSPRCFKSSRTQSPRSRPLRCSCLGEKMIPVPHFAFALGVSVCGEGGLRREYRRHFRSGGMSDRGDVIGEIIMI